MSKDLVQLFSSTLRTGPTPKHLQALNVHIVNELSLDQVVPTEFLPHASWSNAPTTSGSSESVQTEVPKPVSLSNGAQAPGKEEFFVRAKELLHENEDAFRAIQRQPPLPNRQPARIVHFRKFWDGLLMMADHWDTSLDKYLNIKDTEDEPMTDIDDAPSDPIRADEKKGIDGGRDLKKKTYTGLRTGTGRDMPGKYREDTTFSFVETLAGAFRCRLNQPRSQQRLNLQGTMIPILHAASVVRVPKAVREARKGIAEGPMLGVFCREQTSFRDPDEAEGEGKQEILDLLRETGLMLMLAQKRAREGKEEEVPGKDKWWANAPRWGGGEGGEPGATDEENTRDATTSGSSRKQSKKASRTDAWKSMQPPSSIWEKGLTYQRIGKDRSSEYDDVSEPTEGLRLIPTRISPVASELLTRNLDLSSVVH